jgi:hypothetical protein
LKTGNRPKLLAVVHTEEEFDWAVGFDPNARSVRHVRALYRLHGIFRAHGVCPIYAVSYPVVADDEAAEVLRGFLNEDSKSGPGAVVAAHLHPWVCPPIEEEISSQNSYPGNLPPELERRKIETLTAAIHRKFGKKPTVYLSGRYGSGPNTVAILARAGYRVDLSPSPTYDYRGDGGPDFREVRCTPFRTPAFPEVLRVPHTSAYVGWACRNERPVLDMLLNRRVRESILWPLLVRSGAVRRIRLSPEGFDLKHQLALTRSLIAEGLGVFVLSLHSPSVVPGNTVYTRTEAEVDELHRRVDAFLGMFMNEFAGEAILPHQLLEDFPVRESA